MSVPFLSEIRLMSFNFPPKGWALCNGQLLPINQNQALFSLLGITYGGNGQTTFALPNLRGRVPLHFNSPLGGSYTLGQTGGAEAVTLTGNQIAAHTHAFFGTTPSGLVERPPLGGLLGKPLTTSNNYYASETNTLVTLHSSSVTSATPYPGGGGQAHANMQPYLVLNFCIALQGIFPSQV